MRYVLIEGHDGGGKTTFSHLVTEEYQRRGFKAERVKFPTSYPSDDLIARPADLLMFYLNDFKDTLEKYRDSDVDILVCDRSFLSTMVYQGFKVISGEDTADTNLMRSLAVVGSKIFSEAFEDVEVEIVRIECEVQTAMKRIRSRNSEEKDLLERGTSREQFTALQRLKGRYERVTGIFAYREYSPLELEGNVFDHARVFTVDTTLRSPTEALQEYVRRSFEPEYFDTKVTPKGA